jgi:hypothetical protein
MNKRAGTEGREGGEANGRRSGGLSRKRCRLRRPIFPQERNIVEFFGVWERTNNPGFNSLEFEGIRMQTGL